MMRQGRIVEQVDENEIVIDEATGDVGITETINWHCMII